VTPERVGAIVNPNAGDGNAATRFAELTDCFPEAEVEARITRGPADVPAAATEQAAWADLLVVIGGDGTVREAVGALVDDGNGTPVFVVPAGRGNSSYRHLYGDAEWQDVARALADGIDERPLEVGRIESTPPIDETYFVLGFSAGLFRSAIDGAERLRRLPGPLAYLLATVGATAVADPVDVSVAVDGTTVFDGAARLVAVGGGRYRGRSFALLPDSRPGDGRLHTLVVEPTGFRESLSLLRLARAGRIAEHPAASYHTGRTVTIEATRGVAHEVDGTPIRTPIESARLQVVPDAVTVAYPRESPAGGQ